MGAFIAYLHRVEKVQHFFVLAPNLTIYRKSSVTLPLTRRSMFSRYPGVCTQAASDHYQ